MCSWMPTPSLIGYKIPGDDDYFTVSNIGNQPTWLSQTAEIHMQMAIGMDLLPGVCGINTVYRRESDMLSKRRLTEVNLDSSHSGIFSLAPAHFI